MQTVTLPMTPASGGSGEHGARAARLARGSICIRRKHQRGRHRPSRHNLVMSFPLTRLLSLLTAPRICQHHIFPSQHRWAYLNNWASWTLRIWKAKKKRKSVYLDELTVYDVSWIM